MSFSRYNTEDSVISAESVVRGLFSGDSNSLTTFFTSSTYTEYYLDVYNGDPASSANSIQFSIQYGNLQGSGSLLINNNVPGYTPSRVVYGQYRNLVYGTETTNFSFDNSATTASQIYVINFARSRYKESLYPGSFNLTLGSGSNGFIRLTDDSGTTNLTRFIGENRVYYIISGSNGAAYTVAASASYYGMMFPDLNIVILNATSGSSTSLLPWITGSTVNLNQTTSSAVNNHLKLYSSIVSGSLLQLKSEETVSSRYFFTRIKNSEFNYTTNPSIIDANGNLVSNPADTNQNWCIIATQCTSSEQCSQEGNGSLCFNGNCVNCSINTKANSCFPQYCDSVSGNCLNCNINLNNSLCEASGNICNPADNTCVQCYLDSNCQQGYFCDMTSNTCKQSCIFSGCSNNQICDSSGSQLCVDCFFNSDCSSNPNFGPNYSCLNNYCISCNSDNCTNKCYEFDDCGNPCPTPDVLCAPYESINIPTNPYIFN